MASVSAFNDMMTQFLVELQRTFPQEKGIKTCITQFEMLRKANPRKCVDAFMGGVAPFAQKISERDESFILSDLKSVDTLKGLNVAANWSGASDGTKGAIWQYMQTLYMLGTTISAIPADTLSQIEQIAKAAASKMEEGGGENNFDQDALMKTMGSMLGGMMHK